MDYMKLNFDFDGDGVNDSYAKSMDMDGDGYLETTLLDLDGDGILETTLGDSDGDGIIDMEGTDLDGDGQIDELYMDLDGDGQVDELHIDLDGDGILETSEIYSDINGDGVTDYTITRTYVDTDGDGEFDTAHAIVYDERGKVLDTASWELDEMDDTYDETSYEEDETEYVELEPIYEDDNDNGLTVYELENFDPEQADPDKIIGNPDISMQEWECQGQTNRCALYSQKFIIEELTGQEVNMEEMAEMAANNGWFDEDGGTPIIYMNKMLEAAGIESELSFDNEFQDIEDCLRDGGKVIVAIDADEMWEGENDVYSPNDSVNHAVEVIGIDYSNPEEPMVILNDSGNPNGCGVMLPYATFMDAWEDGGNFMVECMPS